MHTLICGRSQTTNFFFDYCVSESAGMAQEMMSLNGGILCSKRPAEKTVLPVKKKAKYTGKSKRNLQHKARAAQSKKIAQIMESTPSIQTYFQKNDSGHQPTRNCASNSVQKTKSHDQSNKIWRIKNVINVKYLRAVPKGTSKNVMVQFRNVHGGWRVVPERRQKQSPTGRKRDSRRSPRRRTWSPRFVIVWSSSANVFAVVQDARSDNPPFCVTHTKS